MALAQGTERNPPHSFRQSNGPLTLRRELVRSILLMLARTDSLSYRNIFR